MSRTKSKSAEFARTLSKAKRASTVHLLLKCARLLNEAAIASLPRNVLSGPVTLRSAHLALFPYIELEEGTRTTELATHLGISKQAVGQLVDDLEASGTVERVADPLDGRAKRVCFTRAGKASMLDGVAHLKSLEPALGKALGHGRICELHSCLLALHDHLEPQ